MGRHRHLDVTSGPDGGRGSHRRQPRRPGRRAGNLPAERPHRPGANAGVPDYPGGGSRIAALGRDEHVITPLGEPGLLIVGCAGCLKYPAQQDEVLTALGRCERFHCLRAAATGGQRFE
jgi:hypothetical protein